MTDNSSNDQLRIGIVGMGPVGAVLAAMLVEAGAYVVPCDIISGKIDKIKKEGLHLENVINKSVKVSDACTSIKELGSSDLDLVVVSVKAPSLKGVVDQLVEINSDKLYVMCAQNGIDNEIEVACRFDDAKTLRMVVNYAGGMSDDNTVNVTFFNPPNYIAALAPKGQKIAQKVADLLNSVKMETVIPEDIRAYIWEKAILNAALSAICAITRRTMKDVMDFPATLDLVAAIVDESVLVAEKEGIELDPEFRRFCIKYLKNAGHHRPSMLVDLDNGVCTEIDQLNGKIVEYGRKHCQPTPLNQCVTALVHLLEHSGK